MLSFYIFCLVCLAAYTANAAPEENRKYGNMYGYGNNGYSISTYPQQYNPQIAYNWPENRLNYPYNGYNNNNKGQFGYGYNTDLSFSPKITVNNDGFFYNDKQLKIDKLAKTNFDADLSYKPIINFNNDGLTVDGKKVSLDTQGYPLNAAGDNSSRKTPARFSYKPEITIKGKQFDAANFNANLSYNPKITINDKLTFDSKKSPFNSQDFSYSPKITINGHQVDAANIDGLHAEVEINNQKYPMYSESTQGTSSNKKNSFSSANNVQKSQSKKGFQQRNRAKTTANQ